MENTAVIIGLGLIGGSLAKSLSHRAGYRVIGIDNNADVCQNALRDGAIQEIGSPDSLENADLTILAIYPEEAIAFIRQYGQKIKKGSIVTDVSGIKSYICSQMPKYAAQFGFTFIGAHPMAGKEKSSYENSEAALFDGASYIITPCGAPEEAVVRLSQTAYTLGFTQVVITTPEEHDAMIAFTSQLPHVLASAYVQSPRCLNHKGFSAGSYRDVSRVAKLNEELWSELFILNKQALSDELDVLLENLSAIRDAVKSSDRDTLTALLKRGRKIKEALGE